MRFVEFLIAGLSTLVGVLAAFAPAYAGDATLFYAPGATPVPAMILAGPKGATHLTPPHERVCFNPSETRERIVTHRLAELFQALRVGRLQGDALRAKLCRWKQDEFVYEIAVLRRDGHLVHVYMNARNGQTVGP